MSWQDIATLMVKHREDTFAAVQPNIPELPKGLPLNVTGLPKKLIFAEVAEITESSPEFLLDQLAAEKLTSTAVTKAFLQRAVLASKLTNCVTELLPERAVARAKYCDEYLAKHRKPIGRLHGLPISVKEHVAMIGFECRFRFLGWSYSK